MARRRYDKGDLESTMRAAVKCVGDSPLYVFATAYGYTIESEPPIARRQHYRVNPDRTVVYWHCDVVTGEVTEEQIPHTLAAA